FGGGGSALQNVAYIALIGPDGSELASSDPSGPIFSPPEHGEWAALAGKALAGETRPQELIATRTGPGPVALAAYPVTDRGGHAVAAVILAASAFPAASAGFSISQALAFFGAASLIVLLAASVFALASSSLVAYLLARRVVRRLERLGQAAEALAAGQLSARVQDAADDELGQLARRFNQMAADLQGSLVRLEEERDRVTGLLKARRELVASVSHELRTPVATARGYLESALRRPERLPDELRSDLETVEAEIGRLQRLIDDLFTLARAEVGRLELRLEPTNIGDVMQRTVETLAPLAWRQWRVQVVAEVAPELAARADTERLQQVLSNLLSNAVRHTPPGGVVVAAAAIEGDLVRLDVRDTGAGIFPEDLPRIFEPFYQGREADGRDGAGLGLAVARELVEGMGGTVQAESVVGEGSCFTVRLPCV
ncbi:MAG: HAMP domain-containing histidine kinase, partial [Chloroflexota bacterium]|nr:HAMP domain-containing histidine kinase [Chloroflexota bacterium]